MSKPHPLLEDERVTVEETVDRRGLDARPAVMHRCRLRGPGGPAHARSVLPRAVEYRCAMSDDSYAILVDVRSLSLIMIDGEKLLVEVADDQIALQRLIQHTHKAAIVAGYVDRRVCEQPEYIRNAIPHAPAWMVS